jgi:hypothetical protein
MAVRTPGMTDSEGDWGDEPAGGQAVDSEAFFVMDENLWKQSAWQFLNAIQNQAPEVLDDLQSIFLSRRKVKGQTQQTKSENPNATNCFPNRVEAFGVEEFDPRLLEYASNCFPDEVEAWAIRHRLFNYDTGAGWWVVEAGHETMRYWAEDPERASQPRWGPDSVRTPPHLAECSRRAESESFMPQITSWDPSRMTLGEFKKLARKQFGAQLDEYVDRAKKWDSWRKHKNIRQRKYIQYEWLVAHVVKLTSRKVLVHRPGGLKRQTMERAMCNLARLLFGPEWKSWMDLAK